MALGLGMAGAMRSVDEASTVASSLLNANAVPLEQMPVVAATILEHRALPGSQGMAFNSSL